MFLNFLKLVLVFMVIIKFFIRLYKEVLWRVDVVLNNEVLSIFII